ncbi:hypothetical protein BN439_2718 [Erwinia amylovora Ea644]|nr:hypothetical protein BN439_2718 [Erwinia amylovora Ea644]CCP07818.1 hypothetical protein BN440_2805 [Erwinia amylovora MR1]
MNRLFLSLNVAKGYFNLPADTIKQGVELQPEGFCRNGVLAHAGQLVAAKPWSAVSD